MGMEEAVPRYLGVFLPFIATLICAHYIVTGATCSSARGSPDRSS
jgi:hypothetical protein